MQAAAPAAEVPPRLSGLAPIVRRDARVLILGSFPGAASLAAGRYYAHPRNQFWRVLDALTGETLSALPYAARLARVRSHRIAIWDVLAACTRPGSLDSSIRDASGNDFVSLFARAPRIAAVAFNGATAARLEPWFAARGLATYRMPSTSPAHAGMSFEGKLDRWLALRRDGWIA